MSTATQARVKLSVLPDGAALVGDPPSKGMVENVQAFGIIQPVVLIKHADGTYSVSAGRRRIKAARLAGLKDIPALVFPDDENGNSAAMAISENHHRSDNDLSDFQAILHLEGEKYAVEQICRLTGLTSTQVAARKVFAQLTPTLLAATLAGQVAVEAAKNIAKMSPEGQAACEAFLAMHGKLAIRDVRDIKKSLRDTAVASVPDDVFEPGEGQTVTTWPAQVMALLGQVAVLIPGTFVSLRQAVFGAQDLARLAAETVEPPPVPDADADPDEEDRFAHADGVEPEETDDREGTEADDGEIVSVLAEAPHVAEDAGATPRPVEAPRSGPSDAEVAQAVADLQSGLEAQSAAIAEVLGLDSEPTEDEAVFIAAQQAALADLEAEGVAIAGDALEILTGEILDADSQESASDGAGATPPASPGRSRRGRSRKGVPATV